jgi:hypothetical protein
VAVKINIYVFLDVEPSSVFLEKPLRWRQQIATKRSYLYANHIPYVCSVNFQTAFYNIERCSVNNFLLL